MHLIYIKSFYNLTISLLVKLFLFCLLRQLELFYAEGVTGGEKLDQERMRCLLPSSVRNLKSPAFSPGTSLISYTFLGRIE